MVTKQWMTKDELKKLMKAQPDTGKDFIVPHGAALTAQAESYKNQTKYSTYDLRVLQAIRKGNK